MKRMRIWLMSALLATVLMGAALLLFGLRYQASGDALMMKAFAGYAGGVPAHFHEELHTALAWLLYALQTALPAVKWLSVLQLALLWLSCALTVQSAARCAQHNGLSPCTGAVAGALLCAGMGLYAYCRIDHAATAALVGAAAVMRLLSVDYRRATDQQVLRGMLLSIGLCLLSYCLSQTAGLAAFGAWLTGAAYVRLGDYAHSEVASRGSAARKGVRGLAIGVMIGIFALGCFWGLRAIELGAMGGDRAWHAARQALCANPAFPSAVTDDMLAGIGWTQARLRAVASGFLYDSGVTASGMQRLNELLLAGQPAGLHALTDALCTRWQQLATQPLEGAQALAAALLALLGLCACLINRRRALVCLCPILALALGALVSALPGAADASAFTVLAPMLTLLTGIALRELCPPRPVQRWQRLLCGALCAAVAVSTGLCALSGADQARLLPVHDAPFEDALAAYAKQKPDKLIFYSPELSADTRLFPPEALSADNIVLPDPRVIHTDALTAQFKRFGLDARDLRPDALLAGNVLFAGTDKGPWRSLLASLAEQMTGTFNWASYEQGDADVCLYRLCER